MTLGENLRVALTHSLFLSQRPNEAPTALFPPAAQHLLHFYLITQQDEPEAGPLIGGTGLPPDFPLPRLCTPFWPTRSSGPAGGAQRHYGGNNMRGDEARGTQVKTGAGVGMPEKDVSRRGGSESRRREWAGWGSVPMHNLTLTHRLVTGYATLLARRC